MKISTLVFACLIKVTWVVAAIDHPLYEYVHRPDDTFAYEEIAQYEGDDHVVHVLNMTSQTWMDESFSTRSVWWHYVLIIRPTDVKVISDQATIFVGFGSMDDGPPNPNDDVYLALLIDLAIRTGSVTVMVTNIPQQPCFFFDDPKQKERSEDDIIAYTWANYMNDTDNVNTDSLLYMPMVKSIVRSMDAITEFTNTVDLFWDIKDYVITGASKRGWTTWLSAIVDDRVVGIAPMVLSMLNMVTNMHHHYQSMGGWSFAFEPYWSEGLTRNIDTPEAELLVTMQDPYHLREHLTIPVLYIKAANDEFFMMDDAQFWFKDLPVQENKRFFSVQNANHFLVGHYRRLVDEIAAFLTLVNQGQPLPAFDYTSESSETTASTTVSFEQEPYNITVWYAQTSNDDNRRDWRAMVLNEDGEEELQRGVWFSTGDAPDNLSNWTYRVEFPAPETGWTSFFITAMFETAINDQFIEFSSEPNIVPNTFGYDDCYGEECEGILK